ncbi:mRNA-decapping enzyme subunit 2 [Scheffersomyces spartinae]|uniref:mRNA-decapping enzyme subunit 2 n=1 Tax=Scheffersomyces spartinae TaxID=45513 RepID=A0A9P8AJR6_9ASCO|nr:mRNA-decapping enzyme subunit 2 [Scheffersomyces spartinae]KAG7194372.1 mRNA-decapping enzyme subunit 2 [Scheffersomyces spartinae]
MSIQLRDGLAMQPVDLVLEDLLARFLVNCPEEDLSSIERVFFQVEEAQWFYSDFLCQLNPSLPSLKLKSFSTMFLEKCPLIWKWGTPSEALSRFSRYKSTIPVRGAAFFNDNLTKLLLVKGVESKTWSFPRGKISKGEQDAECAIREAEEETGFNCRDLLNENDVIDRNIGGKNYKIYLVKNVPEDFDFEPQVRNEIAQLEWHDISVLLKKIKSSPNKYFILPTMMKAINNWINKNKGVVDEQKLMLQTEIKLKKFLGISQTNANENVDAGRELLNILQGINEPGVHSQTINAPSVPIINSHPMFQQALIQAQMPFIHPYAPPMLGPGIPNFVPSQMGQPPLTPLNNIPNLHNQTPPASEESTRKLSIASSNRRMSEANSRELLSILNKTKPGEPQPDQPHSPAKENARELLGILNKAPSNPSNAAIAERKRSKAQILLDLVGAKKKTADSSKSIPSPGNLQGIFSASQPSNELEESLRDSAIADYNNGPKKMTLLKRPSKDSSGNRKNSNASADLLRLLVKQPNPCTPETSKSSRELFTDTVSPPIMEESNKGNDILAVLRGKQSSQQVTSGGSSPITSQIVEPGSANIQLGISNDFETFENFEDFEDFEDVEDFDDNGRDSRHYRNFDIASDDEDLDRLIDDKLNLERRGKLPSKQKVRILRQGELLKDLISTPSKTASSEPPKEAKNSTSLLHLLNGGDTNSAGNPLLDALYNKKDISHDNSHDEGKQSTPSSNQNQRNNVASANLLSLLGKKPPTPKPKILTLDELEGNQQIPTPNMNQFGGGANITNSKDILGLLKNGH